MMRKRLTGIVLLAAFMAGNVAHAGLQLGATRIVYPAGEKSVSMPVMSRGGDKPFLVQAEVASDTQGKDVPFFVSPPIFRLEPGGENQVRITRTGSGLAADRESLYWFSVRGIESTSVPLDKDFLKADDFTRKAGVTVSIGMTVKLIYRPAGLPVPWEAGMKSLRVTRTAAGFHLMNPSPYYMSFTTFQVGGTKLIGNGTRMDNATLAPFSGLDISGGTGAAGSKVSWKVLNDYGAAKEYSGEVL